MTETLEGRKLFAVTFSGLTSGGIAVLNGDSSNQSITVSQTGSGWVRFADSGGYVDVNPSLVNGFQLDAGGGNDAVTVSITMPKPTTIFGSAGHDTIFGGAAAEVLLGGSGNDSINAGGGNDSLDGSDGNDYLFGSAGDDTIIDTVGNNDFDTVQGGSGNDYIDVIDGDNNDTVLEDVGGFTNAYGDPGFWYYSTTEVRNA